MITILTYFSMEGEGQMEQARKLLAAAFEKDPIKQQYCIFYVDHLLASGRISPQMTVSVLSSVAANATNDTVRLDAFGRCRNYWSKRITSNSSNPFWCGAFRV